MSKWLAPGILIAFMTFAVSGCSNGQFSGEMPLSEEQTQKIGKYTADIEARPKSPDAYYRRGKIYCISGRYAQSIPDFDKAIELKMEGLSPITIADSYALRVVAHFETGDRNRALADFKQALQRDQTNIYAEAYLEKAGEGHRIDEYRKK
ncbi:MAG: tetratricopeptide repeat protein [Planctomycetota bacterium]|nr:tetratricopeptide repeat protein [Planctomycetota bacterium]